MTDGPFVETKDLIAGWYVIDVESWDRAVQLAGELSAASGPGGEETNWVQIVEWYDELVRLTDSPVARLNRAVAVGEAYTDPIGVGTW